LPGDVAFKLHDTFGFPLDLSADVCRERDVTVDEAGFQCRHGQAEGRENAVPPASSRWIARPGLRPAQATACSAATSKLVCEHGDGGGFVQVDGAPVQQARAKATRVVVVLDTTPFYSESRRPGGRQRRSCAARAACSLAVEDTREDQIQRVFGHHGVLDPGRRWKVGDTFVKAARGHATQRATPPCATTASRT
jgi:alanyl-tRNA synthetase